MIGLALLLLLASTAVRDGGADRAGAAARDGARGSGSASAPSLPPQVPTPTASPSQRLEQADALYLSGDFDGAARAYRALLDEGWEGRTLHLNMGNALVRAGARGQGMASYLRALRLDPSDADARANLELARAQNADRLLGAAEPSLPARLVARTGDGAAVGLFGAAWVALWTLLWLRARAAPRGRRALGVAALAAALAAVAGGALLAGKAAERRGTVAVVVAPTAPAREGPERTLKTAFELHEGTSVRVLEARGDQARVELENGLSGWVSSADLEVI